MDINDLLDMDDISVQYALSVVRAYCGWHVTPVIQTEMTLDVLHSTNTLLVPSGNIVGLHSIEYRVGCDWRTIPLCDISHSGATWSEAGIIEWSGASCYGGFPKGLRSVVISLTHGFPVEDVMSFISVVQAVAGRYRDVCNMNVKSQSVNGASVTYFGSDNGVGRSGILEPEKAMLDRFKIRYDIAG